MTASPPMGASTRGMAGHLAIAGLRQAKRHKREFDAVITLEDPGARLAQQLRFHRAPLFLTLCWNLRTSMTQRWDTS